RLFRKPGAMPRRLAREAGAAGRRAARAQDAIPAHAADRAPGLAGWLSGLQREFRLVHAAAAQPGDYPAAPAVADEEFLSLAVPARWGCVHTFLEAGETGTVADADLLSRRGGGRLGCAADEVRPDYRADCSALRGTPGAWDFSRDSNPQWKTSACSGASGGRARAGRVAVGNYPRR